MGFISFICMGAFIRFWIYTEFQILKCRLRVFLFHVFFSPPLLLFLITIFGFLIFILSLSSVYPRQPSSLCWAHSFNQWIGKIYGLNNYRFCFYFHKKNVFMTVYSLMLLLWLLSMRDTTFIFFDSLFRFIFVLCEFFMAFTFMIWTI